MNVKKMTSERKYWSRVVTDLQKCYTLSYIAKYVGASRRTANYWKDGKIPQGIFAVRLYAFHVKTVLDNEGINE